MPKSLRSPRHTLLLERLVAARLSAGLTQAQVATRLGKPQSFVAKVEGGERRLDIFELLDLARAIDIDLEGLLRGIS